MSLIDSLMIFNCFRSIIESSDDRYLQLLHDCNIFEQEEQARLGTAVASSTLCVKGEGLAWSTTDEFQ